jgi:hypothetical protein
MIFEPLSKVWIKKTNEPGDVMHEVPHESDKFQKYYLVKSDRNPKGDVYSESDLRVEYSDEGARQQVTDALDMLSDTKQL